MDPVDLAVRVPHDDDVLDRRAVEIRNASSTLAFSGIFLPPRTPSSAVITTRDPQSSIRPFSASGEKPPNTTEWTAPIRAHASIATTVSRNHRHVDRDAIAFLHAEALQRVREFADALVQLAIAQEPRRAVRVVGLPEDRGLVGTFDEVPVQTIRGDVELAVGEPAHVQVARVEARVFDLRERLRPREPFLRLLAPKPRGIRDGFAVHGGVGGGVDQRACGEPGRRRVGFYLAHQPIIKRRRRIGQPAWHLCLDARATGPV